MPCTALVDTGAARSLMNFQTWKRLCDRNGRLPLLKKADVELQTLAGEAIPIAGSTVALVCGKLLRFYVFDDLKHDILLGDDTLQTLDSCIEYGKNLVWLANELIKFRRPTNSRDRLNISAVVDTYRKTIPPVFGESIGDGKRVGVEMTIKTGDAHPIKQPPYRLPLTKRAVVDKEIGAMLEKEIIRPSYSLWASPITLVPKPDGSVRFCVDYRKLNAVTVEDSHPFPIFRTSLMRCMGHLYSRPSTFDRDIGKSPWQNQTYRRQHSLHTEGYMSSRGCHLV